MTTNIAVAVNAVNIIVALAVASVTVTAVASLILKTDFVVLLSPQTPFLILTNQSGLFLHFGDILLSIFINE